MSSGTCESATQTYALPSKIQARAAQTAEANHVEVVQAREETSSNLNTDSSVAKPQLAKRDSTVVKPQVAYLAHRRPMHTHRSDPSKKFVSPLYLYPRNRLRPWTTQNSVYKPVTPARSDSTVVHMFSGTAIAPYACTHNSSSKLL